MDLPECDFCESTEGLKQFGDTTVCPLHINEVNQNVPAKPVFTPPLNINEVMRQNKVVNGEMQISNDLFNAEELSIAKMFEIIDHDTEIKNKPFVKAENMQKQMIAYRDLIFVKSKEISDINSKLRAWQTKFNQLANHLTIEEREKFKLKDITYTPPAVRNLKMAVTKKAIKVSRAKVKTSDVVSKAEQLHKELGIRIEPSTLRNMMISKGLTLETAYQQLKSVLEVGIKAQAKINNPPS